MRCPLNEIFALFLVVWGPGLLVSFLSRRGIIRNIDDKQNFEMSKSKDSFFRKFINRNMHVIELKGFNLETSNLWNIFMLFLHIVIVPVHFYFNKLYDEIKIFRVSRIVYSYTIYILSKYTPNSSSSFNN